MKLRILKSNMTELDVGDVTIFFSYSTPVAAFVPGEGYFRTEKYYSRTTTKHINQWLNGMDAIIKPQEWFDKFLEEE